METIRAEAGLQGAAVPRTRAIALALAIVATLSTGYAAGRLSVPNHVGPVATPARAIDVPVQAPAVYVTAPIRADHPHRRPKWG